MVETNSLCHIFPTEITDLIFQHFTGSELLTLSEATPSFYNYMAASKACMAKIVVKLTAKEMTEEDKRLLVESDRKYKHLEVAKSSALLEPAREILRAPGREWSSVAIRSVDFQTIEDAYDFFSTIQADVEDLVVKNVASPSMATSQQMNRVGHLAFPKLKVFETDYCRFLMNHQLFASCTNLKTLSIKSGVITNSAKEGVQKMLEMNKNLTVLRLGQMVTKSVLKEDISTSIQFSLREFHIEGPYYDYSDRENEVYKRNLNLFLESQADTLEKIKIGEESGVEVMKTIQSMRNMKILDVKSLGHHNSPTK